MAWLGVQRLEIRNVDNYPIGQLQQRFLSKLLWDDITFSVSSCSFLFRAHFFRWTALPLRRARLLKVPAPFGGQEWAFEIWCVCLCMGAVCLRAHPS